MKRKILPTLLFVLLSFASADAQVRKNTRLQESSKAELALPFKADGKYRNPRLPYETPVPATEPTPKIPAALPAPAPKTPGRQSSDYYWQPDHIDKFRVGTYSANDIPADLIVGHDSPVDPGNDYRAVFAYVPTNQSQNQITAMAADFILDYSGTANHPSIYGVHGGAAGGGSYNKYSWGGNFVANVYAGGMNRAFGVEAMGWASTSGTINGGVYGGRFTSQLSGATTAPLLAAVHSVVKNSVGVTNNAYGLLFNGWTNSGTVVNSYGIYADTSIDVGQNRYFIYSLSKSPNFFSGKNTFDSTNTPAGVTGQQTIHKPAFSVNFAAGESSLEVTNSFVAEESYVLCTVQTDDATALLKNATPADGSVTIRLNDPASSETRVACLVTN